VKTARSKLSKIIADKTLKSGVSKPLAREVAAYLLEEHRVQELDSLLRDVQADWAEAGSVEVIAASAHPLTPKVKADIAAQLQKFYPGAKQIMLTEEHDPDIIGGVRLSLANQQLDLSVEAKLNQFKQLTNG
jgi:F0F1-type ATP synthase delta subunit